MCVELVSMPFDIKHFPPRTPQRPILFSLKAATPKTAEETPQERPVGSLEDVDSPLDDQRKISSFTQIIPFKTIRNNS